MDATLTPDGPRYSLAIERTLKHPPEKVWRVLTERDLLKQWFPCDIEGEWKPGAPLTFTFDREIKDLKEKDLHGEVLVVEPPRLLEFRWSDHVIRCELKADGDGTKMFFSDSFEDVSWGARNAAGWEMCLDNLELLLKGASIAKFAVEVWQKKFDHYKGKFEPKVGPQIGMPE